MEATEIEIFEILKSRFSAEESKKIVTFLSMKSSADIHHMRDIFLTKEDKIDLITRMDTHFRWLVGILLTGTGIMIAVSKL